MKRILLVFFLLFLGCQTVMAVEEVDEIQLETEELEEGLDFGVPQSQKKSGIYLDEDDKLKLHMDGHLIKELKLGAVYNGSLGIEFVQDRSPVGVNYIVEYADIRVDGLFKNDKTSFRVNVNPVRYIPNYNYMQTLWQDVWVKHKFNENQSVQVGYYRTPNGENGSVSSYVLDFPMRSQIARNYANARATGIKNSGTYKYFDYDIGIFDSARYFDSIMQGFEIVAKGTVKPLEYYDGKYGHLKIAGSINSGKRQYSYTVANAYVSYEYKKFFAEFEYARANGYNGAVTNSNAQSQGLYTSVKYKIHPKVKLVARCDFFDPDMDISGNNIDEYTAGIVYTINKYLSLYLDYVFKYDHLNGYSSKIIFTTRVKV